MSDEVSDAKKAKYDDAFGSDKEDPFKKDLRLKLFKYEILLIILFHIPTAVIIIMLFANYGKSDDFAIISLPFFASSTLGELILKGQKTIAGHQGLIFSVPSFLMGLLITSIVFIPFSMLSRKSKWWNFLSIPFSLVAGSGVAFLTLIKTLCLCP